MPFAQTDFDFSNSSSLSDLSDPAHAVAPVINVVTPAPEPVGLYAIFAPGFLDWNPAIHASTATCWEDAPEPWKFPTIFALVFADDCELLAGTLSPQAAKLTKVADASNPAAIARMFKFVFNLIDLFFTALFFTAFLRIFFIPFKKNCHHASQSAFLV